MWRLLAITLAPLVIACGGPNEETLIDELRVVAMISEPPEVAPGEAFTFSTLVHIPPGTTSERMTWSCLFTGEGCVESGLGTLEGWVHLDNPNDAPVVQLEKEVPNQFSAILGQQDEIRIPVWTLTCEPDLCPIFNAVRANPAVGSADWDSLTADLANPLDWMDGLPIEGVSLATRTLVISNRLPEDRNQNPTVEPAFSEEIELDLEETKELTFNITDDDESVTLWNYTTIGGFESVSEEASGGEANLSLAAPKENEFAGDGMLYVIAEDPRGGTGLWSDSFIVRK